MMNQLVKSSPPSTLPITGMMMSLTSESTIFPNAAPMITPTARSMTLPLTANSRNSFIIDMLCPPPLLLSDGARRAVQRTSNRGFARFAGADADHLLDRGDENLAVADLAGASGFDDCLDRGIDL